MGLLSALSNAVSGLNVNQQNLNVLSQNISNANTPNYSNEVANQQAVFDNGTGTGVTIENVTRTVDQYLTAEVQSQTSQSSASSTIQSYYGQIENLLGQPGASDSIDSSINSFFSSLQDLANSPTVSTETSALNAGVTVAGNISGLATSLQNLRYQADSQISGAVSNVNADLKTLFTTNNALERASATGQSTVGLLDTRDATLADLSKYVDINPTYQNDGEVSINTTNGLSLLTSTTYSSLNYTPANSVQTFINNQNLSPIQVSTLDANGNTIGAPATLATGGASSSVTTSLTGGSIQGLLTMRDSVIPNILGQLDQLSSNLANSVNTITNEGSSYPPPQSYTGTRAVSGTANASQWSGDVQIALLNTSGQPAASPYSDEANGIQPLTLNLGSIQGAGGTGVLSTDDIIKAINQYYGPPQNKAELGNLNNVQLGVISSSVPAAGNQLNFDFNLNNISSNSTSFYLNGVTVLDSTGATIASTAGGTVTSTQPTLAVSSYTTSGVAGNDTVTLAVPSTSGLSVGETVNVGTPSGAVNGAPASLFAGSYTITAIVGNAIQVTIPGVGAASTAGTTSGVTGTVTPPYATVASGQTLRTGADGSITADLSAAHANSSYFTVEANISTVDANGNLVTSTVSYTIPNNTANTANNLIGASNVTGGGTLVTPTSNQPLATATLVDANGNPLQTTNGSYGNQQGYLKITANNASYTLAINELNSQQQGLPNASPAQAGTNQGFSQYFGLNNFFNNNLLTPTGDTVAGSAINLSVESRIISNPSLISTGTLSPGNQPSDPSLPPNFTYQVASGDNSISQALAALSTSNTSYATSGGMPASSTTFSEYAGQIIAKASNDSTDATNTATDSQTLLTGFTTRAASVSGVNLDQELANTVIYQNAYSASTRVITVVGNMFDQLLSIIQ